MKNEVFESYSVPRAVFSMGIPTMIGSLVMMLYNMADTFFIGQTNDPNQVAAVAITMPVFFLMMAMGNLFGIGGSSLISRCLGNKDYEKAANTSSFCFYGCIVIGLVSMVVFLIMMEPVLKFLGASPETTGHARAYLSTVAYGAVFVIVQAAFVNIVRSEGAARASMIGQMIGTVTNIILDPVFVLIFHMGTKGVGIATLIGNFLAFLFYIIYMKKSHTCLSIAPGKFKMNDGIAREVFLVGIPSALTSVLSSFTYVIYNKVMVGYGDLAVAASAVATKGGMFADCFQQGIAMGIQPLIGYSFTAKNHKRLKEVMRFTVIITTIIGAVFLAGMYIFSVPFVRAFIRNEEVVGLGTVFVRIFIVTAPITGIMMTLQSTFQGLGKAAPGMILTLGRQLVFFLPVIFIGQKVAGMYGVLAAQPVSTLGSAVMAVIIYFVSIRKLLHTDVCDSSDAAQGIGENA